MKKIFLGLIVILSVSVSSFGQAITTAPAQPAAAPASKAVITFKEADNKHEFGSIPQGTPVSYVFNFKNTGKDPLVLSSVTASCGCTTPEWPKEPIAPGASGNIKVTFSAATPNEFTKTITVVSNAAVSQTVLTIHGDVKPAGTATNQTTAPAAVKQQTAPKKS